MDHEYLSTNNDEVAYRNATMRFLARTDVSQRNKDLMMTYLRDAALGKTSRKSAKKKVGIARRLDYLTSLTKLIDFLQKDLDQVTQPEMETFIEALEAGRVRSRRVYWKHKTFYRERAPLSPRYVVDIKISIRGYYRYLLGGGTNYPPLVDWFDVQMPRKRTPSLTPREVQTMVDRARTPRDRALIQVLFDGGFRLGELINIRLKHVTFRQVEGEQRCFFLEAPYSKTVPRTVVLPMPETTKWLLLWLQDHPSRPAIGDDGTLRGDLTPQLFPMTADAIEQFFAKHGPASINKHVFPHLMRHTSATYWANKLSYFQICRRFGWTMTSKSPQTYIDAAGIDEMQTVRAFQQEHRQVRDREAELKQRLLHAMQCVLNAQVEEARGGVGVDERRSGALVTDGGRRVQ